VIERGEIWWTDFGPPRGSSPALRRPALVISSNGFNASQIRTVTVATLTTNTRRAAIPGNVAVPAAFGGLERDSVVNVTQLTTVDRAALEDRVGTIPAWILAQVDDGLRLALGL
jgi:mRNA interferase MazF